MKLKWTFARDEWGGNHLWWSGDWMIFKYDDRRYDLEKTGFEQRFSRLKDAKEHAQRIADKELTRTT